MSEASNWYWQKTWSSFREGSTRLRIAFEDQVAIAVLYNDGAPLTVAGVVAKLPLEVPVVHVAWSGDMVMSARQFPVDVPQHENRVRLVQPGDLSWDPSYGELAFTYGVAECKLPSGPNTVAVYGGIVENLRGFADFCRRRRFEGIGTLRMTLQA